MKHWRWLGFVIYWCAVWAFIILTEACHAKPMNSMGPDDGATAQMVNHVYDMCGGELGPLARANVLRDLTEVAEGFFESTEDRLSFALLVCIESRFDPGVKSKAGAVGLTQVVPRYAAEFSKRCYLSTKGIDLFVPHVSLMTGACQFRYLIKMFDGNYTLALAGYNAGETSDTVHRIQKMQRINPETADYLSRFHYLQSLYHQQSIRARTVPSGDSPNSKNGTAPSIGGPK